VRREGLAAPLDLPVSALADEKCVERARAQESTLPIVVRRVNTQSYTGLPIKPSAGFRGHVLCMEHKKCATCGVKGAIKMIDPHSECEWFTVS
jgi:hypothetical protein